MSEDWAGALRELRGDYLRESAERLDQMGVLLALLDSQPRDSGAPLGLMRSFHAFAGSGATYGFPHVSEIGASGERSCRERVRMAGAVSPDERNAWRRMIDALRGELAEAAVELAGRRAEPSSPRQPEVLIVSGDEDDAAALSGMLAHEGYRPRRARSRAEAERCLAEGLPDAVITDVRLDDGSGFELVEQLRRLPRGEAVPALMLSPLAAFPDRVEAIHCGADGFFEEPVDCEAVLRRVQQLTERNRHRPARVLCVEDDVAQAAFLRTVLDSAGHEVRLCTDPLAFESELLAFEPDVVLMDILLPTCSGYDLTRYLRQNEKHATLPVLFLTTEGQVEDRIQGLMAGGDEHLVKPVSPPLLLSAVAARIERARFLKGLLERDGLTRLLTHTAFQQRAAVAVAQKRRDPGRAFVWVMLDVDRFKTINDSYGHPVGDRVLAALAAMLRRRLRQSDTIGRYGGEEYTILLEDLGEDDAVRLVERLLEEFAVVEHVSNDGLRFHASFSAGVASLQPGMQLDGWKRAADDALYRAKAAGRRRVARAGASERASS